jgi:signal peptidase I
MLKNGDVYLNGNLLDESAYLKPDVKTYGGSFLKDGQTITVPPGQYFVMGDNRIYSSDSREWGFVKQDEVIGKSFFVYWPLSKLGFIKNPY